MTAQELPALPQWLQDILPEPRQPLVIEKTQEGFLLTHDSIEPEVFPTMENAFHLGVHHYAPAYTDTIGGIVYKGHLPPQYSSIGKIFVTSEETGALMLFQDDKRSYDTLQYAYTSWLVIYEKYVNEPDNFSNSYFFLDMHPAFWIRRSPNPADHETKPFLWHTHQYVSKRLNHNIFFVQNSHLHVIEAGSHIPENYVDYYHDADLEIQAESYEQALIVLARKVQEKFDYDGSLRNPKDTPSIPETPELQQEDLMNLEEVYDFIKEHENNAVHKKTLDALRTIADKYPVMTRDMVSRGSVTQWLHENIDQLAKDFHNKA